MDLTNALSAQMEYAQLKGKNKKCDCKEHSGDTSSNQRNNSVQNFTISQIGNTTTALLNVSQGDLADGIGSNACTVIAMYTAVKFLQNGIDCPSGNISAQTVTEFISFMKVHCKTCSHIVQGRKWPKKWT